ncbi:MAG: lipopolysaccharide heptosyltransferase family protein [Rhodospirillaceae bacterium]|nr:lipopolysaccharide heptosyltransferase family protein [Rhodospirillaceae bacterium]
MGPFAAIRQYHRDAHVTLLTGAAFANIAAASPYFDAVWVDDRPRMWDIGGWLRLRRKLIDGAFDRVYDLQTSDRSGAYFLLLGPGRRPQWSGIALGCSHPHSNPGRGLMHTIERQVEQLRMAGIATVPAPDLSWVRADISRFRLRPPYVLLVPGGSLHRPEKRWPATQFAGLCTTLAASGQQPVLMGTAAEKPLIQAILRDCPPGLDLAGQTSLADIANLARGAKAAIGNDTGPMHLIAAAGCRALVLFSSASDPALCAPRGGDVTVLRRQGLADLPVAEVWEWLAPRA